MEIRSGSLSFPRLRGNGPQTEKTIFNFDQPVTQAVALLTGMRFGFSEDDDHHLGRVTAILRTSIDADVVTVDGDLGVRDWSGDWDDDYEGNLTFLLLAELDTGFVNSNLTITGVEHTQAIQFFRSQDHLDPATVQANNSIPLIAGKDTVLRTYVDDLGDPTRPTITAISGVLSVRLPGSTAWIDIDPLNGPIDPRRDLVIDRRQANHTLNFLLPGAFATQNVDYKIRVFEAGQPDVPGYTSASVLETLAFEEVEPLRVRGIGVNFTGAGLNLAAPTQSVLTGLLDTVKTLYPVGRVVITGYDTLTFSGDLTSDSGQSDLLDAVRDMQGDSEDIYYGLVPNATPAGGWLGRGGGDGRVAVGKVGFSQDGENAAHEIGHVLNRKHPCGNGTLDDDYPTYDALQLASIGEIGMDAAGNVQDPSSTLDFMAQFSCGSAFWVSPYTYLKLRPSFQRVLAATTIGTQGNEETLFLNFRIHNGSNVEFRPSFHFPARPRLQRGVPTAYYVVFKNCDGKTIAAHPIEHTDPVDSPDNPFLNFYKPLPFPMQTAEICVLTRAKGECDYHIIGTLPVPCCAPSVRIIAPKGQPVIFENEINVLWEACECDKEVTLTYLLRYSNDSGRTWRTLAPRTTETRHTVDIRTLDGGEHCLFQVLCTSGSRTSSTISEPFTVPVKPRTIEIDSPETTVYGPRQRVTLRAAVFSPDFAPPADTEIEWFSNLDGKIGIGPKFSTAMLSEGVHEILVRTPDGCEHIAENRITITIRRPRPHKHTSWTHPSHTHGHKSDEARDEGESEDTGSAY